MALGRLELRREVALGQSLSLHAGAHSAEQILLAHRHEYALYDIQMHHSSYQRMLALVEGEPHVLVLPPPEAEVLPRVRWGAFDEFFTPAFWAGRVWLYRTAVPEPLHRLGTTFAEEVAACLLGGHGIPAEVGLAAFVRLRDAGLLGRRPTVDELEGALQEPLLVGQRAVRYRFARQKAGFLARCLATLDTADWSGLDDRALRGFLAGLPGIGPKTASWITRNWRGSDAVAILDIHICRACVRAGVFVAGSDPARDYFGLEARFLEFAEALGTPPSVLDDVMWRVGRRIGHIAAMTRPNQTTSRPRTSMTSIPPG